MAATGGSPPPVHLGRLPVEGVSVGGLGEAGGGVGVDINLLGKLKHSDVVVETTAGWGVALVVEDVGHSDGLLGNAGLPSGGEVVVPNPHIDLGRGGKIRNNPGTQNTIDNSLILYEVVDSNTSVLGTGCWAFWS